MAKVKSLGIYREAGTDRTYYAIWKFTTDHLDSFQITWKYSTGNKRTVTKTVKNKKQTIKETVWFTGSSTTEKNKSATQNYTSLYTPPDNAIAIKVSVKPISTTYETTVNKKTVSKSYWTGEWETTSKTLPEETITVAAPSTPSLTANKYNLSASITNIPVESNIKQVEFQFYKFNTLKKTIKVSVSKTRSATASYTVSTPGAGYKVQARGINGKNYSSWSDFCNPIGTMPETPKVIKTITKTGSNQLNLNWDNCTAATSYTVEYTDNKAYFDSGTVSSQTVNESAAQINGLNPGTIYYFRIKASNENGDTPWSTIKDSNTDMASSDVSIPSTPIVTINTKNVMTVKTENVAEDIDLVTFYIQKYKYNNKKGAWEWVAQKTIASVKPNALRVASTTYTVPDRTSYRAKAKGINQYTTSAKKTVKKEGSWSGYSSSAKTIPEQPAQAGITPNETYKKKSPFKKIYTKGSTEIDVSWHQMAAAEHYDIEYTTDRRYFDSNQTAVTQVSDLSGTHTEITGLETGRVYYFRIRAKNVSGGTTRNTSWSCVGDHSKGYVSIKLGTKPSPPTTWSSTTTAIAGDNVTLYWLHNSEDNSADRYGQIALRENSGSWRTIDITNSENVDANLYNDEIKTRSYPLDTSGYTEGTIVEWKVRTKGVIDTWSDFSVTRKITVYARPTLSLALTDAEGEDLNTGEDVTIITSFPFYLNAEAGPANQTPLSYHVSVVSNDTYETLNNVGNEIVINTGDEVYSKSFDISDDLLLEFSAHNIDLQDGVTYTIYCTVSMDSGLVAEEEIQFTINWTDVFYDLDAEIAINDYDYSASIKPVCLDEDGVEIEEGFTLAVFRREFDGRFTEIESEIVCGENTFIIDPHPSLDYARYRIVATDIDTGAISFADLPGYPIGAVEAVFQWDETWSDFNAGEDIDEEMEEDARTGSIIKLPYNIDVSDNNNPDVALVNYIGRQHPVSYYGTQLGSSANWKVDIPKEDTDTLYALRRLSIWMGDVYVREPSGSGYWANIKVSISQTHCDVVVPVTFDIVRVEGGI